MKTFPTPSLHTAADDNGKSRQPALSPIFKKVSPLLITPFQKAMRSVGSPAKKKVFKTYFSKVNLGDKPMSPKNKKMLKDILVDALRQDRGWLEFVAEQILDGAAPELADVLGGDAVKAKVDKAPPAAKKPKGKAKKASFQVLAADDATGAMVSAICLALDDASRFLGESAAVHGEREDTTELVSLVDEIDHLLEVFVGYGEGDLDKFYTGVRMYPVDKADPSSMARSGKNALKDIEILRRDHKIPPTLVPKIEALEAGIKTVLGEKTAMNISDVNAINDNIDNGVFPEEADFDALDLTYPFTIDMAKGDRSWNTKAVLDAAKDMYGVKLDGQKITVDDSNDLERLFERLYKVAQERIKVGERTCRNDVDGHYEEGSEDYDSPQDWIDQNKQEYIDNEEPYAPAKLVMLCIEASAPKKEAMKTAGRFSIESIAEGSYPEMHDIEAANFTYPITIENLGGNSDTLARLRAAARELDMLQGLNDIVIDDEDALYDLFAKLEEQADVYEKATEKNLADDAKHYAEDEGVTPEEWFEQNYNEYLSDVHDPAIALVQLLGKS